MQPVSALDAQDKHYLVYTHNGSYSGFVGTCRTYGVFCDAVRDRSVAWSGRGKIPWQPGAHRLSFTTRREAEAAYRTHFGLEAGAAVPHFG